MSTAPIPVPGALPKITTAAKPDFAKLARVGVALAETVGGSGAPRRPATSSVSSLYDDDLGGGEDDSPLPESSADDAAQEIISSHTRVRSPTAPIIHDPGQDEIVETTLGELADQMGIQDEPPARPVAKPPTRIEEAARGNRTAPKAVTLGRGGDDDSSGMSHMAGLARMVVGNMNRRG